MLSVLLSLFEAVGLCACDVDVFLNNDNYNANKIIIINRIRPGLRFKFTIHNIRNHHEGNSTPKEQLISTICTICI